MIFKWTMQKFRRDNVKEIISNLFANKVDVDHPENKYKDFKDLEDNVEKRLQNRQAKYQMKLINYLRQVLIFDEYLKLFFPVFLIFQRLNIGNSQ